MKPTLTTLFATQARIEARKPKPHARGEGIRAVKAFVAMNMRFCDYRISDALATEIERDLLEAFAFEPMLLDFPTDGGLA